MVTATEITEFGSNVLDNYSGKLQAEKVTGALDKTQAKITGAIDSKINGFEKDMQEVLLNSITQFYSALHLDDALDLLKTLLNKATGQVDKFKQLSILFPEGFTFSPCNIASTYTNSLPVVIARGIYSDMTTQYYMLYDSMMAMAAQPLEVMAALMNIALQEVEELIDKNIYKYTGFHLIEIYNICAKGLQLYHSLKEVSKKDAIDKAKEKISETTNNVKEQANDIKDQAKEQVNDAKEQANDAVNNAKEQANEQVNDVKDQANDIKEQAKEQVNDAKEQVNNTVNDAKEQVNDKINEAKDQVNDVKEQANDIKNQAYDAYENKANSINSGAIVEKTKKTLTVSLDTAGWKQLMYSQIYEFMASLGNPAIQAAFQLIMLRETILNIKDVCSRLSNISMKTLVIAIGTFDDLIALFDRLINTDAKVVALKDIKELGLDITTNLIESGKNSWNKIKSSAKNLADTPWQQNVAGAFAATSFGVSTTTITTLGDQAKSTAGNLQGQAQNAASQAQGQVQNASGQAQNIAGQAQNIASQATNPSALQSQLKNNKNKNNNANTNITSSAPIDFTINEGVTEEGFININVILNDDPSGYTGPITSYLSNIISNGQQVFKNAAINSILYEFNSAWDFGTGPEYSFQIQAKVLNVYRIYQFLITVNNPYKKAPYDFNVLQFDVIYGSEEPPSEQSSKVRDRKYDNAYVKEDNTNKNEDNKNNPVTQQAENNKNNTASDENVDAEKKMQIATEQEKISEELTPNKDDLLNSFKKSLADSPVDLSKLPTPKDIQYIFDIVLIALQMLKPLQPVFKELAKLIENYKTNKAASATLAGQKLAAKALEQLFKLTGLDFKNDSDNVKKLDKNKNLYTVRTAEFAEFLKNEMNIEPEPNRLTVDITAEQTNYILNNYKGDIDEKLLLPDKETTLIFVNTDIIASLNGDKSITDGGSLNNIENVYNIPGTNDIYVVNTDLPTESSEIIRAIKKSNSKNGKN